MTGKLRWRDYKSDMGIVWCPGCGNYGLLTALHRALAELELPPEQVAVASGIGCSGRVSGYMRTYGIHGVHGRALPIAQGIKLAKPELTVIAAGGDGDGLSIGAGHFPHAARRNTDITYILFDNHVYGLTKGHVSPTSPLGHITPSSVYGTLDEPLDPLALALVYKAPFIARGFSADLRRLTPILKEAIAFPGFSFVQVLSPCVTFRGRSEFDAIRERAYYLGDDYDQTNRQAAFALTEVPERLALGVIYKAWERRLNLHEKVVTIQQEAEAQSPPEPVEELVRIFEP